MAAIPNLDLQANSGNAIAAPTYVDARVLAAATSESIPIPTLGAGTQKAAYARFSGNTPFYVNFNGGTAATPAADIADGTSSVLNPPGIIYVGRCPANIGIIAPAGGIVTIEWFM